MLYGWMLVLPCSDQDGLRPKMKHSFVRHLPSGNPNKTKFSSNTLADIHSFSCHRCNQTNQSLISSHLPCVRTVQRLLLAGFVPAGALSPLLPILPQQSFTLQQETSYKADNIFSPNVEIS